jgi:hypothetical protein
MLFKEVGIDLLGLAAGLEISASGGINALAEVLAIYRLILTYCLSSNNKFLAIQPQIELT